MDSERALRPRRSRVEPAIEYQMEMHRRFALPLAPLLFALIAVPLGFSMMMLRLIQSILRDLRDIRDGRPVFTGTKLFD